MPRTRNPHPAEFREQIIALAKAGHSVESLAREFEPYVAMIHGWVKQAEIDGGLCDDGLTSAERDELRRLRKENRRLRTERDILSKAAAWFAANDVKSFRSSNS
ncbi:transposase [Oricola indica]|jgi:transposase|uniref:transposase n=1 Tax=Oricola indica TaxID=2872591 RepID=UPI001CBDB60D|nr:transposase [Oricola indica]